MAVLPAPFCCQWSAMLPSRLFSISRCSIHFILLVFHSKGGALWRMPHGEKGVPQSFAYLAAPGVGSQKTWVLVPALPLPGWKSCSKSPRALGLSS